MRRLESERDMTQLIQNTFAAEYEKRRHHPRWREDTSQDLKNINDAAIEVVLKDFGITDLKPYPEINAIEEQFCRLDFDFDIDEVREI